MEPRIRRYINILFYLFCILGILYVFVEIYKRYPFYMNILSSIAIFLVIGGVILRLLSDLKSGYKYAVKVKRVKNTCPICLKKVDLQVSTCSRCRQKYHKKCYRYHLCVLCGSRMLVEK